MAFISRLGGAVQRVANRISYHLPRLPTPSIMPASSPGLCVVAAAAATRGMATSKLFIGGLSWSAEESALKEAFSSYGEVVEARIITDRSTGRSKGFGFIGFTNEGDAEAAKEAMDGQMLAGRIIRVDYAIDKPAGFNRGFGGSGGGFGGEGVKRDDFSFGLKDNLDDRANAETDDASSFGRKSFEEGNFGEASSAGGWKSF